MGVRSHLAAYQVEGQHWLHETISLKLKNKQKVTTNSNEMGQNTTDVITMPQFFSFFFKTRSFSVVLKLASNSKSFISIMLGLRVCTTILGHTNFTTTQSPQTQKEPKDQRKASKWPFSPWNTQFRLDSWTHGISDSSQFTSIPRHHVSQDGIHTLKCTAKDRPQ